MEKNCLSILKSLLTYTWRITNNLLEKKMKISHLDFSSVADNRKLNDLFSLTKWQKNTNIENKKKHELKFLSFNQF